LDGETQALVTHQIPGESEIGSRVTQYAAASICERIYIGSILIDMDFCSATKLALNMLGWLR